MIIRLARTEDLSDVLELAQLLRLNIPGFYWHTRKEIDNQICQGRYWVAVLENRSITGIINIMSGSEDMYINTLAVHTDYRNIGIATQLIEHAKELAKKEGKLQLFVDSFDKYRLKDFYIKKGFSVSGRGMFGSQPYWSFVMPITIPA